MNDAHEQELDAVRAERDQSPTWIIRLGMALIGVLLLVGAFIAWRMHWSLGGGFGMVLPWVAVLGVLLGAGAIIESVKTSVWITLLAGIFAMLVAAVITGRYVVNLDASSHGVFVVDRYTGETHYCSQEECTTLSEGVSAASIKKLSAKLHAPAKR
ncbi:MAG: hypothetical protein ACLQUZ_06000 [Rhizomicrobium sp.]